MQPFSYQPGASLLHRSPPSLKLGALLGLSLAVFVTDGVPVLAAMLGLLAGLALLARVGVLRLARALALPAAVLAAFSVVNWMLVGPGHALVVMLRLATLLLAASLVTATTPASAVLEMLERALLPLERAGLLHAQKVAFTLSLAVTLVPVLLAQVQAAREAQVARGASGDVRALMVPLLVRVLKAAQELSDAAEARGFPRARRAAVPGGK